MLSLVEKKEYHKNICAIGAHTFLQELSGVFSNLINSFMLQFLGRKYLSATTFAGQLVYIYSMVSLGLSLAVLMLSTQYYGKKDIKSVTKIFNISLIFSFVISVIFFIVSFFMPEKVMAFFTTDIELIVIGSLYLKYFSFVFLFNAFSKMYMTILKSVGKVKINTIVLLISTIVNVICGFIFIFGFMTGKPLGTIGASIASSIAAFVEVLFLVIYSLLNENIKFSIKEILNPDKYFVKEIFKFSIPNVFTKFVWVIANATLIAVVGRMSREVIDAYSFIKMLANIACAFATGVCSAYGILIGNELGTGNIKKAKEYGDDGYIYSYKIGTASALIMIILGALGAIFTHVQSNTMFTYATITLVFAFQYFTAAIVNFFNQGPFSAGGEVEFLALADTINMWVFMVPLTLLLFYVVRVNELVCYFFLSCTELTKIPALYSHYKKYVWARDLTKNERLIPLSTSFADKYKRDFNLRLNISLTEFFTKRFENSTDIIFSLKKGNYVETLSELQKHLDKVYDDKTISNKIVIAMEELYTSSRYLKEEKYGDNVKFDCDIGLKIKNEKARFIYYDNGLKLNDILSDKEKINIKVLTSIADKLEYKRVLNLNKVLIRINVL